jgi:hypothetical protein
MPPPTTAQPAQSGRLQRLGAALTVPNFRRYVAGQALSLVGTWVETVAQGLLVLHLTHSGVLLGLTTATRYLPVLVFSPYAGLLVDRFPKRRVLLITQAGLGFVSLLIGVAVLTDRIALWQVFVLGIVFGTFSAADNPARQAFASEVVGPSLVRDAVTLNSTLVNVARVLGPTLAAVVVGGVGIGWCFVINAVSFLAVIASLLALDKARLHPSKPAPKAKGQLRAGFRYAAGVPEIIRPLAMMALIGTFVTRHRPHPRSGDRGVLPGRCGDDPLPHHGELHRSALLRPALPRSGHGPVVDGPGRKYPAGRPHHRRPNHDELAGLDARAFQGPSVAVTPHGDLAQAGQGQRRLVDGTAGVARVVGEFAGAGGKGAVGGAVTQERYEALDQHLCRPRRF